MLIAVPAHCLQRASVLILLRVRAMLIEAVIHCSDTCYVLAYLYWAAAQAEPGQRKAVVDSFVLARSSLKSELSEARPEHHWWQNVTDMSMQAQRSSGCQD
jgi:hypothetical protein